MVKSEFVGVDGCPAGWFSVGLSNNGKPEFSMFRKFEKLLDHYQDAKLILVDIPIGLPTGKKPRDCDADARKKLGRRHVTVFTTPTRTTVESVGTSKRLNYETAKRTELKSTSGKRKISKQAYAIIPKIAEVDEAIRARGKARLAVREVHPEICFWALAGRKPVLTGKKSRRGVDERKKALETAMPGAGAIYDNSCRKFARKDVARDDILDALVAAITAYRGHHQLKTLPVTPARDEQGFAMEMVYWIPQKA